MELMIGVALIALLASVAVPSVRRAHKRSLAVLVKGELKLIDDAVGLYAIESNKPEGATVTFDKIKGYLKPSTPLYATGADIFGNSYGTQFVVNTYPKPNIDTYQALSDVTDVAFWSPFGTP